MHGKPVNKCPAAWKLSGMDAQALWESKTNHMLLPECAGEACKKWERLRKRTDCAGALRLQGEHTLDLMEYRENLEAMARTMQELFGVGVLIADERQNQIVNNFRLYKSDIHVNSVITKVIIQGEPLFVPHRRQFADCQSCPDYDQCQIDCILSAPILVDGACVGAIAMLIPAEKAGVFERKSSVIMDFLVQTARNIACMLQNDVRGVELEAAKKQMQRNFDAVTSPIALTNSEGYIHFYNKAFLEAFGKANGDMLLGQKVRHIVNPYRVDAREDALRIEMPFISNNNKIYRLDTIRNLDSSSKETENYMFLFEQVDYLQIFAQANRGETQWALKYFFGDSEAEQQTLKNVQLAVRNNLPILIEGHDHAQLKQLVYLIHRNSYAAKQYLMYIDCDGWIEHLQQELFGTNSDIPGYLQYFGKGTLCLYLVNHLPMYLQERLADYLTAATDGRRNPIPRLYSISDENLEQLVEKNVFSRRLFAQISANRIVVLDMNAERKRAEAMLNSYIGRFAAVYGCEPFDATLDDVRLAVGKDERVDLIALRREAEILVVRHASQYAEKQRDTEQTQEVPLGIVNKQTQMREMLQAGINKNEIAERLGISRATLYRWIEKCDLKEHVHKARS